MAAELSIVCRFDYLIFLSVGMILYYHGGMNIIFLLGLMAYVGPVELKYLNDAGRANINAFFGNISGDSLVLYV